MGGEQTTYEWDDTLEKRVYTAIGVEMLNRDITDKTVLTEQTIDRYDGDDAVAEQYNDFDAFAADVERFVDEVYPVLRDQYLKRL